MLILWILFGVVIGVIGAYVLLGRQHRKAMADLEGSWYEKVRRAEDAAAKAMAEAEAVKAGDDPKMVSLRRIEEPATEVASPSAAAGRPANGSGDRPRSKAARSPDAVPGGAPAEATDDLTRISGVGPVLQEKLYRLGITTYRQIADLTPEDIARVDRVLDFPGRVEREDWVGQARKMIDGQGQPA